MLNVPSALPAILVPPPLLLTAKVSKGSKINLYSLDTPKLPPGVPSLRHAELARVIRVKEVSAEQTNPSSSLKASSKIAEGQQRSRQNWLTLLVREALSKF